MRFAVVGGVGEILMFLGKMMISALTALAFYCLITYVSSIAETIFEPILLIVVLMCLNLDRFHHRLRSINAFHGSLQHCDGHSFGMFHHRREQPKGEGRKGSTVCTIRTCRAHR